LIVDETRRSGGVSEGVVSALVDAHFGGSISRVNSEDSFVPLGQAANHVLLGEDEIDAAARALVAQDEARSTSGRRLSGAAIGRA
jgi:2-oxoisovalerate dehydrogenase E1 component